MTSLLDEAVPALKRAIAPPGQYATLFPGVTDADLEAYLLDGLALSMLEGAQEGYDWETVTSVTTVTPDLDRDATAITVLWTSAEILRRRIENLKTHVRYVATGGVTFEQDQAVGILIQLLKDAEARKVAVIAAGSGAAAGEYFTMFDQYLWRIGLGG